MPLGMSRPAFMDEYERLEAELKHQYEAFVQKFISLSYLENELEDYNRLEQEKMVEREVSGALERAGK